MSKTKLQIEDLLPRCVSSRQFKFPDLKDDEGCYGCKLWEAIDRLVTEAILEKLKSICQDNWQCFIPEKYMLDQIKELQSQLSDKDNK